MTTMDIFHILREEIHSTVFATPDENSLPQTGVIDLMLADENGLYFLTARGKSFYERLTARPFVALSGMKGSDTVPRAIDPSHCIHCGNCFRICPVKAVEKLD